MVGKKVPSGTKTKGEKVKLEIEIPKDHYDLIEYLAAMHDESVKEWLQDEMNRDVEFWVETFISDIIRSSEGTTEGDIREAAIVWKNIKKRVVA